MSRLNRSPPRLRLVGCPVRRSGVSTLLFASVAGVGRASALDRHFAGHSGQRGDVGISAIRHVCACARRFIRYGRMRIFSCDRAAHGCARKMPDPLPTRLRSALTPSLTNREHRVHGSTTTDGPGAMARRLHRHGLPLTVTFLTGTSGHDFFDMSNVRTCPYYARTLGSERPTEPSSHLPNVGDVRHCAIGVPSNLAPVPPEADPASAALGS